MSTLPHFLRILMWMRWPAIITSIYLVTALVSTWPLALNFGNAVPLGTEHEVTVPVFSLWNLWWTADRLTHAFANYWDAPFFYPNQGVLTYSEPMPLLGLLVAPLWYLHAPAAVIYNVALLTVLVLNGIFAYRVVRALEAPLLAALLGGVLTITLPFIAKVHGVLPNMTLFGMLWTLDGFIRFGRSGTIRWAVWAVLGFIATYLAYQQHAFLFTPFAGAAALVALVYQRFQPSAVVRLAIPGVFAAALILLVALPALRIHASAGFERREQVVQALSAQPIDFVTRPSTASVPIPPPDPGNTAGLFPGILVLVLALEGGVSAVRNAHQRWWIIYLVASGLVAFLLAFGLNINVAGWRPFATLRMFIPGVAEIRSVFRFTAIMQMCLALLATLPLAHTNQGASYRGVVLITLLGILAAAENLSVPTPLMPLPASPRLTWTAWLRAQPADTVIVHIPFPPGIRVEDYQIEAWRLYAQTDHHKPMVNGYSGYFPQTRAPDGAVIRTYIQFQLAMAEEFPTNDLLCVLSDSLRVNMLVIDQPWLTTHRAQLESYKPFLQPAYTDHHVQIYVLQAPPSRCQPQK